MAKGVPITVEEVIGMSRKSAFIKGSFKKLVTVAGLVSTALLLVAAASAQDRDRDRDGDRDGDRIARLEPGTIIVVRTNEFIDSDRGDHRIYAATVDQDVRGEHDRIVVPRGSAVELIVRVALDSDVTLDLESLVVNGQRYGLKTDPKHIEAHRDGSLIGGIVGAISGGEGRGRAVKVARDTVISFRLQRPLELGVPDRGVTRDGQHYHDESDQPDPERDRDHR